jgi:hypothetical protein
MPPRRSALSMSMPVFWYVYQVGVVVFFVQGLAIPFLLLASGILWRRQNRRLDALRPQMKRTLRPNARKDGPVEQVLESLPKLRPLNCLNCAGAVLLWDTEAVCPSCGVHTDLPEDYAATASLRHQVGEVLKSALAHWRVARFLTHPATRAGLGLLALFEFLLFPLVLIGAETYGESWLDPVLEGLGETGVLVVGIPAFLGFILWMLVFLMLRSVSKGLGRLAPAAPVLQGGSGGREASTCQSCGGGIEYDAGDFACICNYCNVVNYRAQFARRERAKAQAEQTQTTSALFHAMNVIDDMNGTFLFVMSILVVGSIFLVGGIALGGD